MKMPLRWAQSFADIQCTPQEFSDKMTMSGSKVEKYECEAEGVKNIVIGRVDTMQHHPDADTLWICQLNIGEKLIQIVTSAQNLKVGDVVPVAVHGSVLPGGKEIKRGKLRGVESDGMMCSHNELGFTLHDFAGAVEDGILVLDEEIALGTDAIIALGMDDVSFEFEITPNRPDCLSIIGLAREAAATFGVEFKEHTPCPPYGEGDITEYLDVVVEAEDICSRYIGAMVDNVRIRQSPRWLRERLRLAGVRPINNIVDITNYVMLEYGHPMHAFDYAYVNGGKITVRRANDGERIETLDGVQRSLTTDMAVIADEKGAIAIAGVMGGEYSGVYETTTKVVFETACFNGPSVRSTAKKLGLRTESSGRFEKGLDPSNCMPALMRALELVAELDAGDIVGGMVDRYPSPCLQRTLRLDTDAVNRLLGTQLDRAAMVGILLPLGFEVEAETVLIPSWRGDIKETCDFAEEIARFIGYNKMESSIMEGIASARLTPRQTFDRKICVALTGYGFWECETFSFYSPKVFDMIALPTADTLRNAVKISNPLGEDTSIMRSTALPSILTVVANNWAARNENVALFEQATEYLPSKNAEDLPQEIQKIMLAAYGDKWDYFAVKGAIESLLKTAGISDFIVKRSSENPSYHPGRCAEIYAVKRVGKDVFEIKLGILGEIHPVVLSAYGIKASVCTADINLDTVFELRGGTVQFKTLPKFPAVTRDLALVVDMETPAADLETRIKAAAGKTLEKLSLFDVYTGEKLGENKKSLAYSLVLRGKESTLTDEDADKLVSRVLKKLKEIDAVLRS